MLNHPKRDRENKALFDRWILYVTHRRSDRMATGGSPAVCPYLECVHRGSEVAERGLSERLCQGGVSEFVLALCLFQSFKPMK